MSKESTRTASGDDNPPPTPQPRERCSRIVEWRRAVLASNVSFAAKAVGLVLHEHMTWRGPGAGGNCWPSLETIGREAGASPKTVKRALRQLDDGGYITRRRGGGRGRPTSYVATLPKQGHPDPPSTDGDDERAADDHTTGYAQTGSTLPKQGHPDHDEGSEVPHYLPVNEVIELLEHQPAHSPAANAGDELLNVDPWEARERMHRQRYDDPFKLGRDAALVHQAGAEIDEVAFRDLIEGNYGFDPACEAKAWAGYRAYLRRALVDVGDDPW